MFDDISGWRAGAEQRECRRLYIVVSPNNVVEASRLLSAHRIPHSVEGEVPNFRRSELLPADAVTAVNSPARGQGIRTTLDGDP